MIFLITNEINCNTYTRIYSFLGFKINALICHYITGVIFGCSLQQEVTAVAARIQGGEDQNAADDYQFCGFKYPRNQPAAEIRKKTQGPTGAMDHMRRRLAKIDHVARNMEHVSTQTGLCRSLDLRCVVLAGVEDHSGRQLRALRKEADSQAYNLRLQLCPSPRPLHMAPQSGSARGNRGDKDCLL